MQPAPTVAAPSARTPRIHHFDASVRVERAFSALLACAFAGACAQDVSEDAAFRRLGVDVVYHFDGHSAWVDDKADSYTTGNVALEFASRTCWGELLPGWLTASHMGWLRYGFVRTGDVFFFPMAELRAHFVPQLERFQPASAVNRHRASAGVRHVTFSALVPLEALLALAPGAFVVSLAEVLGASFAHPTLLPPAFASRRATVADALAAMAREPGTCAPLAPDLERWWAHGVARDRMRANAGAVGAMTRAAARCA